MNNSNVDQITWILKDLENLEILIKIETLDGKVSEQSGREYVRILNEVQEQLINIK